MSARADILSEMPLLDGEAAWTEWFETLTGGQKTEVMQIAGRLPRVGPIEGPQRVAFNSLAKSTGYGGSAGGGKSALLALLALLSHHRSVMFRYDAKQLRGVVDDVIQFVGTSQGLNRQSGVFYFGDQDGHMLEWGGLGKPGSEMDWRGRAHDLLAVDEVTELPLKKLLFLKTWLRTVKKGQADKDGFDLQPSGSARRPDRQRAAGAVGDTVLRAVD